MQETKVTTFFYGSYMNLSVLKEVDLVPDNVQVARLLGFDISIRPLANLIRSNQYSVYGILASASHRELDRLYSHARDVLGGIYLAHPVVAHGLHGELIPALCYIAPSMEPRPASNAYIDRIVTPAKTFAFPSWYIDRLESFRSPVSQTGMADSSSQGVPTPQITLERCNSQHLWSAARRLIEEYATSLDLDLAFQDFEHEIQSLPTEYGPPDGCFILASQSGTFVGCGGLRRFSNSDCEMKRLYVVPGHRGEGVGRIIAEALIEQARQLRYMSMLLDTLPSMHGAQALYSSLGFRSTSAYRYNPVPGASYWRLEFRNTEQPER
jgi:GNAT superfamily N-acetyltransferase